MKTLSVDIKLTYTKPEGSDQVATNVDIQMNGVPKTLIIECLQKITKGLCIQAIEEAEEFIPMEGISQYLDARRKVDWENFNKKIDELP